MSGDRLSERLLGEMLIEAERTLATEQAEASHLRDSLERERQAREEDRVAHALEREQLQRELKAVSTELAAIGRRLAAIEERKPAPVEKAVPPALPPQFDRFVIDRDANGYAREITPIYKEKR